MSGYRPWLFPGGFILMILFWALVITGIVLLVRYLVRGGRPGGGQPYYPGHHYQGPNPYPGAPPFPGQPPYQGGQPRPMPEHLLAERFARGEIDEAEYRQRLSVLRGDAPAPGPGPATPPGPAPATPPPGE